MGLEQRPIDQHLFDLVANAVKEGLERVRLLEAEKGYIGTYFEWPSISQFDNGLPRFSKNLMSGPTDYKDAFGRLLSPPQIRVDELKTFQSLLDYAESNARLKNYFKSTIEALEKEIFKDRVFSIPQYLIDRYIHTYKDALFSVEHLIPIYLPLEAGFLKDTLQADIVIPILFLKFDFNGMTLNDGASIEHMNDDFQLARISKRAFSPGVHDTVIGAATHALVLHTWKLLNKSYWEVLNTFSEVSAYPLQYIDNFFAAIRIATGVGTGYAQLLSRPIEWALRYTAHLPPLEGTSIRAYPTWFEEYYWNSPVPTLTNKDVMEIGRVFSKLLEIENNKLKIVIRRLNRCFLREIEEDSILDATIAMEALLSDDERQEMTHKLALRMAALSRLSKNNKQEPVEVFHAVKKIYRHRSAIVHGSTKPSKKREIALSDKKKVPSVTLAIEYL
jgi:hypothetical protein